MTVPISAVFVAIWTLLVSTDAIAKTSASTAFAVTVTSYVLFSDISISLPFTYNKPSDEPSLVLCMFNVYSFSCPSYETTILTVVISPVNFILLVLSLISSPILLMFIPASSYNADALTSTSVLSLSTTILYSKKLFLLASTPSTFTDSKSVTADFL